MTSLLRKLPALSCQVRKAGVRAMSSNLNIVREDKSSVAVMQMNRPPVNSLNLEMLTEMQIALDKLENDKTCRGVILSTLNPSIFSAGLDIMEMYNPQEDRLREFWRTLQNVFMKLYGSPMATVAAISGHSPAGGCLLSLCCDHRIMAEGKFTIGLNETLLGIVAPFWFQEVMSQTVGLRETQRALQLGKLYSAEEAKKIGLVDELVPKEKVLEAAQQEMKLWLRIPDHARVLTKENLRRPLIQNLLKRQDEDIENFVTFISKPMVQKSLGMYIENLKKKK